MAEPGSPLGGYLDASATTPPSAAVLEAMATAQTLAWANPSSLHGPGLAAAECLERSRQSLAASLSAGDADLIFTSGASESIHLALLGSAALLPPGRLVISAVEHPATLSAAAQLRRSGWSVAEAPVDSRGLLQPEAFAALLAPPTRLVSLIWGQSEVGAIQDLTWASLLCRQAGVPLHLDAVQVVGHRMLAFDRLDVDLLSCTAHKLQGPRGIALLLRRRGHALAPLIGGSQEGGLRGGTESVVLAAGFARALKDCDERLASHGGGDPVEPLRDELLARLLERPGVALCGPPPGQQRLPHHISLLVGDAGGRPLSGRALVRRLGSQGLAVSSGSACSSGRGAGAGGSPVLRAMGLDGREAASGLRISLGPWLTAADLAAVPQALETARQGLEPLP